MSTVYFAVLQKEALKHMLLITLIKINETLSLIQWVQLNFEKLCEKTKLK